jgi:tetratricopeptide (TPR) repeat protein
MPRTLHFLNLAVLLHLMSVAGSSQVTTANGELAEGMSAQGKSDYSAAIGHLRRAIALDPKMIKAHFTLAAIADLWCDQSEGDERCKLAVEEYKKVLELDPLREDATRNLAYALYQADRAEEAESYYRQALALDAKDPDARCGVAALDQKISFRIETLARLENKLGAKEPLIESSFCHEVRDRNLSRVEEGIALLTQASQTNEHSVTVMAYMAELYQERAAIQCNNPRAYRADTNTAVKWYRRRKETSKRHADDLSFSKCLPAPPPPF